MYPNDIYDCKRWLSWNFPALEEKKKLKLYYFRCGEVRISVWRPLRFSERAVRGWGSRPTGWGEQPEDVEWLYRKHQAQMVESIQELEDQLPDDSSISWQVSNFSQRKWTW